MTTTDQATVLGIFSSREQAEQAVEELHRIGFGFADIGFVTRDEKDSPRTVVPGVLPGPATSTGMAPIAGAAPVTGAAPLARGADDEVIDTTDADFDKDDTPTRIAAGATGGGVVGGLIGAAATLLIPGLGPITAAGVLVGALTGLLTGSVAGGLVGALTSMGVSEEEASYYNEEVAAGRVLVTVNAPNRQAEAREVMRRFGAMDTQTRSPFHPANPTTQPGNSISDANRAASTQTRPEDYSATTDTTTPRPDITSGRDERADYPQETAGRQDFASTQDSRSGYPQKTAGRQDFASANDMGTNYQQETTRRQNFATDREVRPDYTPGTVDRQNFTPAREASPDYGADQVTPETNVDPYARGAGNTGPYQADTSAPLTPPPPPPTRNETDRGQDIADATTQSMGGYPRPEGTSANPYPQAPYQQQSAQSVDRPDSPTEPRAYSSDQSGLRPDYSRRSTRPERPDQSTEDQSEPRYEPWQQQPPQPPRQQQQ